MWVSNESAMDVYFYDLSVVPYKEKLAGEEGYYPFGLAMNALKSQAGTVTPNAYKYNSGTELTKDLDVDYYETYLRQFDAQVGRFTGVDVLSEATFSTSVYAYAANDPIYFNDPSGALKTGDGDDDPGYGWNMLGVEILGEWGSSGGGISQFEWDNLLYYAGYGSGGSSGISYGGGSGGGGPRSGGGGGSSQPSHYGYEQWGKNKGDLDKKPYNNLSSRINKYIYDVAGSQSAYRDFNDLYTLGSNDAAHPDGFSDDAKMLEDHFMHGDGSNVNLSATSAIAKHILNADEFKTLANDFEEDANDYYNQNHSLEGYKGNAFFDGNHMPYLLSDLGLTTVMGGHKAFDVSVSITNGHLSFTYTITDVFGAGYDDAGKWYFPGLPGLYYLQHYGEIDGATLQPFIWTVTVPSLN